MTRQEILAVNKHAYQVSIKISTKKQKTYEKKSRRSPRGPHAHVILSALESGLKVGERVKNNDIPIKICFKAENDDRVGSFYAFHILTSTQTNICVM